MKTVLNPTSYLSFLQVDKKHNLEENLYYHLDCIINGDLINGRFEDYIYLEKWDDETMFIDTDFQSAYFSEKLSLNINYHLTPLEKDYHNFEGQRVEYTSGGGEVVINYISIVDDGGESLVDIHPTTYLHELNEILTIIYHN